MKSSIKDLGAKEDSKKNKADNQSMFLRPTYFFDTKTFAHRDLLNGDFFVWEVLTKLPEYLTGIKGSLKGTISSQAYLLNPETIIIGEGSVVEPGAYIKGPCIIGKNCMIRHGAYIRGFFICGDGCVIGHDTEIKNTLFLDGVHAAHFAYLGDSILGNHVNLGAGTKCANLRMDQGNIKIQREGASFDSGLRKFGAVMGDGAQTGCNSVTNPGTLLGKEVICYPGTTVSGFVPSNHIVKAASGSLIKKREDRF